MSSRGRVLVVDDEAQARSALSELLTGEGYGVETAADGRKAMSMFDAFAPDVVLTDLRNPGMDGLELLRSVHRRDPESAVIVMTAHGAVDTAIAALREGADDYLWKPLNFDELSLAVERGLERRRLRAEAGQLRRRLFERQRLQGLVGSSPAMAELSEAVRRAAESRSPVLIVGESGTGKELVATAIVAHSSRAHRPFVKLACAAAAETPLESELFGHERGAFAGAQARRDGRFRQAEGGTLFLDEVDALTPATQAKLLRFLQDHEFERLGGGETIKADVRLVAATNRNLPQLVKDGRFREGLLHRLNVVTIEVPPLRARTSDIPLLAMHFLRKFAAESSRDVISFSDEALDHLSKHAWPGNVRELEIAVEHAVALCRGSEVRACDLPSSLPPSAAKLNGAPKIPGASIPELEKYAILRTLEFVNGSTRKAAEMLAMSARTIQYRLKEYQTGQKPYASKVPKG